VKKAGTKLETIKLLTDSVSMTQIQGLINILGKLPVGYKCDMTLAEFKYWLEDTLRHRVEKDNLNCKMKNIANGLKIKSEEEEN